MNIALTTVGAKVAYCVEATKGTMPTSGYTDIPGIVSAPEIDLSADTLDASTLSDTITAYVAGRQDPGGEKSFEANNTSAFRTAWGSLVTAYETAIESDKAVWFAYIVEGDDDAFYFSGQPMALGHGGLGNNEISRVSPKIILHSIGGYAAKPTTGS